MNKRLFMIGIMAAILLTACSRQSGQTDGNALNTVTPAVSDQGDSGAMITQAADETAPVDGQAPTDSPDRTGDNNTDVYPTVTLSPSPGADSGKSAEGGIDEEEIIKNTNYVPGFYIIKEHSFQVDLENWGKVFFISACGEGEFGLDSLYMYLADKDNKILYEFPYFYGNGMQFSQIHALEFRDVNNDGLKDAVVIAEYMTGIGPDGAKEFPVAGVYFQQSDGFTDLPELDEEINASGMNDTVDSVVEYLSGKDITLPDTSAPLN